MVCLQYETLRSCRCGVLLIVEVLLHFHKVDVLEKPTNSSSLAPYTELPCDGSNEASVKYQAPIEATNLDCAFSLFLSNENIAGEIIG